MKTLMTAAAAVLLLAAVGTTMNDTTGGSGVDQLDADGLPPRIEYPGELSYSCDENWHAVDVVPADPDANRAAERGCTRMHLSLDRLDLPDGVTVLPGGIFEQEGSNP
ncbi:hypothetical protein AB0425_17680 [Actinosynnema sp. NPDC051121]